MFVRLPLIVLCFVISNTCFAGFHQPNKAYSTKLPIASYKQSTIINEAAEDFSTLLQRRILQILAHQLIDDNNQANKHELTFTDTHYNTKTFSVSIDTVNTAFYRVSIKDSLQNKETLIKIPR